MKKLLAVGLRKKSTARGVRVGVAVVALASALAILVIARDDDRPARSLSLSGGSVWVPFGSDGEVVQVDSSTGHLAARVGGLGGGELLVTDEGPGAVVVNSDAGRVFFVDEALQEVRDSADVPAEVSEVIRVEDAAFLVGEEMFSVLDAASLVEISAAALRSPKQRPPAVAGEPDPSGRVWLLDGSTLVGADRAGTRVDVDATEAGDGAIVVVADGAPWVIDREAGELWTADLREGVLSPGATCQLAGPAGEAAASAHDRWVAITDPDVGSVMIADVAAGTCSRSITLAEEPANIGEPVVTKGLIYVPVISTGEIVVIDPEHAAPVGRGVAAATPGLELELVAGDGGVVFYARGTNLIGAIEPDGTIHRSEREAPAPVARAEPTETIPTPAPTPSPVPRITEAPPAASCDPPAASLAESTGFAEVNEAVRFSVEVLPSDNPCEITGVRWTAIGPRDQLVSESALVVEIAFDTDGVFDVSAAVAYRTDGGDAEVPATPDSVAVSVGGRLVGPTECASITAGDRLNDDPRLSAAANDTRQRFFVALLVEDAVTLESLWLGSDLTLTSIAGPITWSEKLAGSPTLGSRIARSLCEGARPDGPNWAFPAWDQQLWADLTAIQRTQVEQRFAELDIRSVNTLPEIFDDQGTFFLEPGVFAISISDGGAVTEIATWWD